MKQHSAASESEYEQQRLQARERLPRLGVAVREQEQRIERGEQRDQREQGRDREELAEHDLRARDGAREQQLDRAGRALLGERAHREQRHDEREEDREGRERLRDHDRLQVPLLEQLRHARAPGSARAAPGTCRDSRRRRSPRTACRPRSARRRRAWRRSSAARVRRWRGRDSRLGLDHGGDGGSSSRGGVRVARAAACTSRTKTCSSDPCSRSASSARVDAAAGRTRSGARADRSPRPRPGCASRGSPCGPPRRRVVGSARGSRRSGSGRGPRSARRGSAPRARARSPAPVRRAGGSPSRACGSRGARPPRGRTSGSRAPPWPRARARGTSCSVAT